MIAWRMLAMAGVILLCAGAGHAAEFKSSQGFSITYPATWLVMSTDQPDKVRREMQSRVKQFSGVDLRRLAVIICEDSPADFVANLNVVVGSGKAPTQKSDDEYRKFLTDEYRKLGVAVTGVQVERTQVGGLEAVSVHYNAVLRGVAQPQRQWQVTVLDKRRTLSITCSAPEADFARYEPVFAASVASLRLGPDSSLAGWLDDPLVRYGLIGVVVACVLLWLRMRMQRKE
ncbi:MAG: hypothetical protein NTX87_18800 [Planctomycetota bacterium]|nr:hypothetical protein [Planctomycetota bacterium]